MEREGVEEALRNQIHKLRALSEHKQQEAMDLINMAIELERIIIRLKASSKNRL